MKAHASMHLSYRYRMYYTWIFVSLWPIHDKIHRRITIVHWIFASFWRIHHKIHRRTTIMYKIRHSEIFQIIAYNALLWDSSLSSASYNVPPFLFLGCWLSIIVVVGVGASISSVGANKLAWWLVWKNPKVVRPGLKPIKSIRTQHRCYSLRLSARKRIVPQAIANSVCCH